MSYGAADQGFISIHAPRGGSDLAIGDSGPLRWRYFNPRSPRGERRFGAMSSSTDFRISIHAPRGGSDKIINKQTGETIAISIHAPRGGSDIPYQAVCSEG